MHVIFLLKLYYAKISLRTPYFKTFNAKNGQLSLLYYLNLICFNVDINIYKYKNYCIFSFG